MAIAEPDAPPFPLPSVALAGLHLRMGALALARAELEALDGQGALGPDGLADLAEARWRSGDLAGAAEAADRHLAAGGSQIVALVVAAEAAAASGRPTVAREHVAALGDLAVADLEAVFAGMPRRAFWPFAPAATAVPMTAFAGDPPGAPDRPGAGDAASEPQAHASRADAGDGSIPLWDDEIVGGTIEPEDSGAADPGATGALAVAARMLSRDEPDQAGAAITRLALALRTDPSVAAEVAELLAHRREPEAYVARGDALRLMGFGLEAEAAYAAAADALLPRGPHRRGTG